MPLTFRPPAPTDGVSFFALLVLATGLALRRDRHKHPPLMAAAFVIDLGLVLYLELTRGAIDRAAGLASPVLSVHVGFAVTTLVLNIALVASGVALWRGAGGWRGWHRRLAGVFVVTRLATFLTAFFIPAR